MNIIKAINSKKLFRPVFRDLDSWQSWLTLLRAFFGLKMSKADLALYQRCTGRDEPPVGEFKELWAICGRRGGKSFIASVTAVFLALFNDYTKHLVPGEHGVIQIIAADRSQAGVILRYIKGILHSNPVFEQYIQSELRERVDLTNGITIETMSCSFRSIRGRSLVCAIFDEIAFWRVDGANPDTEILTAVRPGMATIPNSKLIVISSPYARTGVLYEHHRDYYGSDDPDILVWQSDTRTMNPTIDQGLIDREATKDPSAARAEWYAEFREDIESFLSPDAIDRCVVPGRHTVSHREHIRYQAFCDPSGGRRDAMTMAIAHNAERLVINILRAWKPPFDPAVVVNEICEILKQYRILSITGDRYGAAWVSSAFEKNGIAYRPCELSKSDLYLNLEARVNTQQIELPDDDLLVKELVALERRRGRSGKDSVDHPPRGQDDRANAIAGACYEGFKFTGLIFPELAQRSVNDGRIPKV
jgi:hypothetical protein